MAYGKILVVVYGCVKNFDCSEILIVVKFWLGIEFFYGGGALVERIFPWLGGFGHGNFWTCGVVMEIDS